MKKITLFSAVLLTVNITQAQLGGLIRVAKKGVSEIRKSTEKAPDFDFSGSPMPPMITFSSLLKNVEVANYGRLDFTPTIAFLPQRDKKGKNIEWGINPYIHVKVFNEGNELADIPMIEISNSSGLYKAFGATCKGMGGDCFPHNMVGAVKLETYLSDQLINVFEFTIEKKTSDDIYSKQKDFYFPGSPWDNWAMVSFEENSYETLKLEKFFRNTKVGENASVKVLYSADLLLNGQVIGKFAGVGGKPFSANSVKNNGVEVFSLSFRDIKDPKNNGNGYWGKKTLKDGDYEIKVNVDGAMTTYKFTFNGGKINMIPQQDPAVTKDYPRLLFGKKDNYFVQPK